MKTLSPMNQTKTTWSVPTTNSSTCTTIQFTTTQETRTVFRTHWCTVLSIQGRVMHLRNLLKKLRNMIRRQGIRGVVMLIIIPWGKCKLRKKLYREWRRCRRDGSLESLRMMEAPVIEAWRIEEIWRSRRVFNRLISIRYFKALIQVNMML
jgi:hypothetical protein